MLYYTCRELGIKIINNLTLILILPGAILITIILILCIRGADKIFSVDRNIGHYVYPWTHMNYEDRTILGNGEKCSEIIRKIGTHMNDKNIHGQTVLHWSSGLGDFDITKCLVENGAKISIQDDNGKTALHLSSQNDHLDIVQYLVENGANISAVDNEGQTAIHVASKYGHIEIVEYLVRNGGNINARDNEGRTALHIASINRHFDVAKILKNAADKALKIRENFLKFRQLNIIR